MMWLLLLVLTSSVCGKPVMKMSLTFYQTEENNDITIRWDSQTKTDLSRMNLICVSRLNSIKVLYQMIRGLEDPESAHRQFLRRVLLDKDALKEGRLRLHLFLVAAEDSGDYWCGLTANYNKNTRKWGLQATVHFVLNVTQNSHGELSATEGGKVLLGGPEQCVIFTIILPLTTLIGAAVLIRHLTVRRGSKREVFYTWRREKVSSLCCC